MAHELLSVAGSFDRSFYSRVRTSRDIPWHGHGIQGEGDESVLAVAERLHIPHVWITPAYFLHGTEPVRADDHRLILGAVPDPEGSYVSARGTTYNRYVYGAVKGAYHLYPHRQFVDDFAASVPAPCETMGILRCGATVFIAVRLPAFDLGGDELQPYLLASNTTDGVTAIHCRITPVRVVCANTLTMALGRVTDTSAAINHYAAPSPHVTAFLRTVWASSAERVAAVREACDVLCHYAASARTVMQVTADLYPVPARPHVGVATADLSDAQLTHLAAWEAAQKRTLAHQSGVLALFEDSPTRTAATTGNLWGVYQAVTEYEDHYKPRSATLSRFVGEAAKRKAKAFDLCLAVTR